ncbi:DUF4147 domain-containing protein [Sulfitobacter sp. W002]|uniref:glycerate kinase type-2 family protein n=1 Tax=Sulfitobacter sp. W002 TaxID=2867024 RepID=UPI0021A58246|nr:DUF4147 domain-containing protein [Sulfitobacter sp. W002]UWR30942.1 DUF4147 domain-containing protein [Sulfitobacter sp. W002]
MTDFQTNIALEPELVPSLALDRALLRAIFDKAVEAADPMLVIPRTLPPRPLGRVVVIGAGKASARMAEAVTSVWGGCEGLILTRDGYARPAPGIRVIEAAHPVPDLRGQAGTEALFDLLKTCEPGDFVLALISGGGSALLTKPAGRISLSQEQQMTRAMLASGAPINDMNIIRKHLSLAKGGALAAACSAPMLSLIISDVPGDDMAAVACGPTVGDCSTAQEARALLELWSIPVTPEMAAVLDGPPLTCRPGADALSRVENRIVAAPSQSLLAAAELAQAEGMSVRILGDALEGEACDLARHHARMALDLQAGMRLGDAPLLLLSGGECTVTHRGKGIGGPNAEYALALAVALQGRTGVAALACDTDGVDGAADAAGAVVDALTLPRAVALSVDPERALWNHDSHSFFAALGDQVITGPTLTNVNDFRAILIRPTDGYCNFPQHSLCSI